MASQNKEKEMYRNFSNETVVKLGKKFSPPQGTYDAWSVGRKCGRKLLTYYKIRKRYNTILLVGVIVYNKINVNE